MGPFVKATNIHPIMTKIIFLDIDGVLFIYQKSRLAWSKMAIEQLNRILDSTDARLVISSTWRLKYETLSELKDFLTEEGINTEMVIGRTPSLPGKARGLEIDKFLKTTQLNVSRFVIIDDGADMDPHYSHLFRTKFEEGLTKDIADAIIRELSKT